MNNLFIKPITFLGETVGRNTSKVFGIYQEDRFCHMFILGQTGTGKSTLIEQMVAQDIQIGEGFCLIDPHGDLSEAVKPLLPDNAIYWDIAKPECPYGYNPLSYVVGQYRPLVTSGIIDALKSQWSDAWGVRMEHMLRFAILALLSQKGSSLANIVPMFTDKNYRARVLPAVTDKEVLKFWNDEYPNMNYKNAFDGVAPIANKFGAFLSNPVVRKSLCEPEKPLRFREIMDEGKPLVVNLAKGRLGSDVSDVLGGLVLSIITNAAMTRDTVPVHERRPFYVYVDEFSSFTTETMAGMLSELRKFKVGLVLAGQYLSGITPAIVDAIFGNVGTMMIFRIGAHDAPLLSRQLGRIEIDSLINQPNYRFYARLMIEGRISKAFSGKTVMPTHR